MATPTLANSSPQEDSYDGNLIDELTEQVKQAEKPKPPQAAPKPLTERDRQQNAASLLNLWAIGEQLDPLKVALNGFPDVNSSRAYYAGVDRD